MTFMDPVATLVDAFAPDIGPLTVERRNAPTKNAYGEYVPATASTFQVYPVACHQLTGRDLDQLPEADRNNGAVQFYARDGSFPGGVTKGWRVSDGGKDADVILYNGRRYRLAKVPDFSLQGRAWCAIGVLEEVQETA